MLRAADVGLDDVKGLGPLRDEGGNPRRGILFEGKPGALADPGQDG